MDSRDERELRAVAHLESVSWDCYWNGELKRAVEVALQIVQGLRSFQAQEHRTMWLFIAAAWSNELAAMTGAPEDQERASWIRERAERSVAAQWS